MLPHIPPLHTNLHPTGVAEKVKRACADQAWHSAHIAFSKGTLQCKFWAARLVDAKSNRRHHRFESGRILGIEIMLHHSVDLTPVPDTTPAPDSEPSDWMAVSTASVCMRPQ